MALVNQSKREVNVKIVYTGLPQAGKTTNLSVIYQRLKPEFRGLERSIPMGGCSMHLCEFQLPGTGAVPGYVTRYHLYTLTGDIGEEQWRMVLKGVDGIVFVMDANAALTADNREAFASLLGHLNTLGVDLSQLPIVVQANSMQGSSSPDAEEVLRLLAMPGLTAIPANAGRGEGVLETLTSVVRKIATVLQKLEIPAIADQGEPDVAEDEYDVPPPPAVPPTMLQDSEIAPDDAQVAAEQFVPPLPIPLTPESGTVEVPLRLMVAGIEKEFILSIALRESGTVPCEPMRGAAYVR